jgi:hypothetical protein
MNMKLATVVSALALGLGGCASDPGMGDGMVYRDGGYYAPAREGYGDYYVAPEEPDDWYGDDAFYGAGYDPFVFGPSWYGGGSGYCSVRYRFCPSGWYGGSPFAYGFGTSLWIGFGTRGYYDPWGGYYEPWAYSQAWGSHHGRGHGSSHGWRPPHQPQPAQETQDGQSTPWQAIAGIAAEDEDGGDRTRTTDAEGRFLDGNGDGKPDGRRLRWRQLRAQPVGSAVLIGAQPVPVPQAVQPVHPQWSGGGRTGGQARGARSEGGGRMRSGGDGGQGAPRQRRRGHEG